jgi:hypothetical protein
MAEHRNKSRAGLIGLGLLYMWVCAAIAWIDLWNSSNPFANGFAFIGMAMVSVSGLAIVFYTSSLDEKVKKLEDRLDATEYEASRWKSQAENALEMLEERN